MTVLLPAFLADANWFLLALAGPVSALVALVHPKWRAHMGFASRHSAKRLYLLWALLVLSSVLAVTGVSLEVYHGRGCPNSAVFRYEIENLARFVYELCSRQNVPYWAAFGNLLFVMRRQRRIPVGDTDSDIGVVKSAFMQQFGSVSNFSKVVRQEAFMELQRPVHVVYHSERELVQIYLDAETKGSHADIWLYREEVDAATGGKWLVNEDRTVRSQWLPYDQVLPLHDEPAFFLNVPVMMPRNASFLAQAEYGASFMTPLTMRMECIENMVNGYTFYKATFLTRLRYATTFLALVTALTLLAANYITPLNRALRLGKGIKGARSGGARAWLEAAQRGPDKYFV
ncbi:hypothetical protein BBJ28_00014872 [Nothophytophthora sp. Chile5]|nr:hypothetical protein BBJ28_00014872 [Nothophytophthora sp. Chile5]